MLREGEYGLSVGEIFEALRVGARGAAHPFEPQLAFKHWRPLNFERMTDMTHAELVRAFDLPINATALGYCATPAIRTRDLCRRCRTLPA